MDAITKSLDAVWAKLQKDARLPQGRRFEYRRCSPTDEPDRFPILYFEEGLSTNKQATTAAREHKLQARIRFFLKSRNPQEGQEEAKQRALALVNLLTETPDDRRLRDAQGQTLCMNVECPKFAWGSFARDPKTNEIVFAGTIDVVLTLLI